MTLTTRQQRNIQRIENAAISAAAADELSRFNGALAQLAHDTGVNYPVLHTAFGDYSVVHVSSDWWYSCVLAGHDPRNVSYLDRRSFVGCNDGTWADLLRQVGVSRHPRWTAFR